MAYAATRVGCCAERIMSVCNSHHVTTFSVRLFADRSCRNRIGVDMSNMTLARTIWDAGIPRQMFSRTCLEKF